MSLDLHTRGRFSHHSSQRRFYHQLCDVMPMVADAQGCHPLLEVHLDNMTVSSRLNDIHVLTTESCRVSGELLSPEMGC